MAKNTPTKTSDKIVRTIFEQCGDGLIITDSENRIIHANQSVTKITGYTIDELLGKNPDVFKSQRQGVRFYQSMWKSLRSSNTWHGGIWNRIKDGSIVPMWLSISCMRNSQGKVMNYFGIFNRVSEQDRQSTSDEHLRYYDALTDLPNRFLFQDRLHHTLLRAGRNHEHVEVMLMDIDNLKLFNESMGHQTGDELIKTLAERLASSIRKGETFARIGGDEFAVILADIPDALTAGKSGTAAAERITRSLREPLTVGGIPQFVSVCIGITVYPDDAEDSSGLLSDAESAMYHAKKHGPGSYQFYAAHMNARAKERVTILNQLHTALQHDEFSLHFQPQIHAGTGKITGLEALLRWNNPELGNVSPAQFIPLLEESRLILPVGEWVLTEALGQYKQWQTAGIAPPRIAINISARQFDERNLATVIGEALKFSEVDSHSVEIEITESMIMANSDRAVQILHELKSLGVDIAIDDFGTGYSSMAYLKRFPLDRLKIDRSFVQDITNDTDDAAITTAIIALAHNLSLQVIAEGVETEEQLSFLRKHDCEEIQGYFFSRPLPPDECTRFLAQAQSAS